MPQKTIFTKFPLLSVQHSFLSCGLVRSDDQRIKGLYKNIQGFLELPSVWEGTFRLAAMLMDDPVSEPVAGRIMTALAECDDGSFCGSVEDQISVARAGLALFEYNTDRNILKRIASWCRYLEIEWDQLFKKGRTIFSPADLMEFLVKFYQASGIKSVLRLCTKLRSAAFDWTTSLHTIQQVIPLESTDKNQISFIDRICKEDLDYEQKQILLNHAVMVADGIRYSLFAGIFSGNRQDLSAGKNAWNFLQKHYRAICGGTTSGPFLDGSVSNACISTEALASWTLAFSAQMLIPGSDWAVDELIRVVFNGLSCCLKEEILPEYQLVNNIADNREKEKKPDLYAKASRAVAAAINCGIAMTETGFRINYLPEARFIMMIRKQPVVLYSNRQKIIISLKGEMSIPVSVFRSATETADISVLCHEGKEILNSEPGKSRNGHYLHTEKTWHSQDQICFEQKEKIITENTHHQGLCWFVRNRLMVYECSNEKFRVAAAKEPSIMDGQVKTTLYRIEGWHLHHDEPEDIPVLPNHFSETEEVELVPYDCAARKVSMFPRINPLCLK